MKPVLYGVIFATLCAFFLGVNVLWLRHDHSPPGWDDAFYLSHSLRLYDALTDGGVTAFGRQFLTGMREKPPLIAALPAPVYLVFGRKPRAALAVNLFALLLLLTAVFRLAWFYAGPRAGLIAAAVLGTMPMIYGLSHWYLVECGLTALVCLVIWLPAALELDAAVMAAVGVFCGLGLLMKFSFPLYVAAPLAFLLWKRVRFASLAALALPVAAIALPWYVLNFAGGLRTALKAGSSQTAQVYGTGEILSLADIAHYLRDVANCGPTIYFVAFLIAAPFCYRFASKAARRGLLLAAIWTAPLILLAFGHYRDLRYAAPLFPAVALALGILLDAAIARLGAVAGASTLLILGLGFASMLQTSFGVRPLQLGGLLFVQPRFIYAGPAEPAIWPYREVLHDLYGSARFTGGERKRLVVANDTLHFNIDNFALAALADRLPFDGETTAYETDPARLRQTLAASSYFLFKDGGDPESPFNRLGAEAIAAVRSDANFAEMGTRRLPDGSLLHLFRNTPVSRFRQEGAFLAPGLDALTACSVNFDGKLELTGLSMERRGQTIEVKYRWLSRQRVARDYWSFTHILDEKGAIVGYLDHPILKGEPPTAQWTEGSIALERLQFTLPPHVWSGAFRLRLGLFHRESGDRLPIASSSFPLADSNTAAVTPLVK